MRAFFYQSPENGNRWTVRERSHIRGLNNYQYCGPVFLLQLAIVSYKSNKPQHDIGNGFGWAYISSFSQATEVRFRSRVLPEYTRPRPLEPHWQCLGET